MVRIHAPEPNAAASLPIGLDYHTISNGPRWGHQQATPAEQEAELELLRTQMPPNAERLLKAHADFHFHKHKHHTWADGRERVQHELASNASVAFQET